jgi:hypothetical protein
VDFLRLYFGVGGFGDCRGWGVSDAISKAIEALENLFWSSRANMTSSDHLKYRAALTTISESLQAMQGETYRFHCTNCGWKGDYLMAHKSLCSGLYMEHYPPQPAVPDVDVNQQLVEALKDMLSGWRYIREVHGDLYGVGWDRAQKAAEKALLSASKGEAVKQPAVPDGLHQMIVDYIRDDFETLQDGGDWCVITPEDVEEQLKYLRKHDLLIQHPTDPERVMVAMLSAAKGE